MMRHLDVNQDNKVSKQEFCDKYPSLKYIEKQHSQGSQPGLFSYLGGLFGSNNKDSEALQLFKELDEDGSGSLDLKELIRGVQRKGVSADNAVKLMHVLDVDGDGLVSQQEFVDRYSVWQSVFNSDALRTFQQIDTDDSGFIEVAELGAALQKKGLCDS